jgi:hypothetical protein
MRRRLSVLLGVALLAVLATTIGTAGFGTLLVDRGVEISVAGDDAAYLGFDQRAVTTNGTTNLSVTVTNRLPTDGAVTVEVGVGGATATVGSLGPGDAETVAFERVACGDAITVDAAGDDVAVALDRAVACG